MNEKLKEDGQYTIEEKYEHIKKSILEFALEALEKSEKQRRASNEIWWNEEIEKEIKEKKELYRRWLNSKTTEDREQYENKRNTIKRIVEEAKRVIQDEKCTEIKQYIGGRRCREV